jgi:hypothetical protein
MADPDAASAGSTIDVIINGLDGALWRRQRLGGAWLPWTSLGFPHF